MNVSTTGETDMNKKPRQQNKGAKNLRFSPKLSIEWVSEKTFFKIQEFRKYSSDMPWSLRLLLCFLHIRYWTKTKKGEVTENKGFH